MQIHACYTSLDGSLLSCCDMFCAENCGWLIGNYSYGGVLKWMAETLSIDLVADLSKQWSRTVVDLVADDRNVLEYRGNNTKMYWKPPPTSFSMFRQAPFAFVCSPGNSSQCGLVVPTKEEKCFLGWALYLTPKLWPLVPPLGTGRCKLLWEGCY